MISVEKGVPMPNNYRGGGNKGKSKYPFADMEVGDSFFVSGIKPTSMSGVRVWRVE